MVTPFGLRRRLSFWIRTDKEFSKFIYFGKEKPPITLFEFFKIDVNLEKILLKLRKVYMGIFKKKENQEIKTISRINIL